MVAILQYHMPYLIIKFFLQIALRLFFRRIDRKGLEAIDNGKPALIIANHTASFLDAWLMGTFVKRKIYFFTRGDVFEHPIANRLLRSVCLLPVYRISEGKDKLQHNDVSNEEAMKILAGGGAVMIFAEGRSDVAKILLPLKKGPFRLAAQSVEEGLNPTIIPAGINYITAAKPLGDVYLRAVEGTPARDFFGDGNIVAVRAATEMMRHSNSVLSPLVWHAHSEDIALNADELLLLAKNLFTNISFAESQQLLSVLNSDEQLNETIKQYRQVHETLSIKKPIFFPPLTAVEVLGVIAFAPFALPGYLFNFLPIRGAKAISDKKVSLPDFYAPVFLAISIVFTLIWYIIWGGVGLLLIVWFLVPLVLIALAISGILYLKIYRIWLVRLGASIGRKRIQRKNPDAWRTLMELHQELLETIKGCLQKA